MNRNEYIQQRAAIDEAAKEIALDLIRENFPSVEWTPHGYFKLWQNGTLARLRPDYDESNPAAGDLFEVNLLTGTVLYVGPDFSKMTSAAINNPTSYTVEQRGETAVFTIWRGSEAAVVRFEAETHTGSIAFRPIKEDEQGTFIKLGAAKVYRTEEVRNGKN